MKSKRIRILLIVLAVLLIGFIAFRIIISRIEANLSKLTDMPIRSVDLNAVEDGTYTGTYSAFPVSAEVQVAVKDHVITGIELVKHTHGQGSEAEAIPKMVVAAQSLQVDAVAGATYSSKVILKAIEDALIPEGTDSGK